MFLGELRDDFVVDSMDKLNLIAERSEQSYGFNNKITNVLCSGCWSGRRCFILGGGPSLNLQDLSLLSGELVIGINRAYEKYSPSLIFFMDVPFYVSLLGGSYGKESLSQWNGYKGLKVALCPISLYKFAHDVYVVRRKIHMGVGFSLEEGIYGGNNSGIGAVMLAIALGANPIYLLGYDMKCDGDKTNWHDGYVEHPSQQMAGKFNGYLAHFCRLAPMIKAAGVDVVNVTPGSVLDCFDKLVFESVLD